MTTFLNIGLGDKLPKKFIWKHFIFSSLWILGVLIVIFRLDVVIINKYNLSIDWLQGTSPIILFILIGIVMLTQKWYYSLALFVYPILAFVWFIPKTILHRGKIYLFGQYVNFIFSLFKNLKFTILHFGFFCLSVVLLFIIGEPWTRWLCLVAMTYFYISYIARYIIRSFRPAQLFGNSVESTLRGIIKKGEKNESFLITTFVKTGDDEKIPLDERKKTNIPKLLLINYALNKVNEKLNSFSGIRAYAICLSFELVLFLITSIAFFWFANLQLFRINESNFQITGHPSSFEFLYYTIKTITLSGIDSIKPISSFAKLIEVSSFFVLGILLLIIIISVIFSLRQNKINENVKLTTALCVDQNRIIKEYALNKYGTEIQNALTEFSNISKSLKMIKNIIDKIF